MTVSTDTPTVSPDPGAPEKWHWLFQHLTVIRNGTNQCRVCY
jgi:hypothetical protein